MKLCVDRNLICDQEIVKFFVCSHIPELWPKICYTKLCVDRDMNCVQQYVTWSFV